MLKFTFPSGDEVDADDIEADWRSRDLRQLPKIATREATEDVALVIVDGCLGGGKVASCACFYFDEAESWSIPGDNVDIAWYVAGGPAARDDDVALALQVEQCSVFAVDADGEMRGHGTLSAPSRKAIESGERLLCQADTHLSEIHCNHSRPIGEKVQIAFGLKKLSEDRLHQACSVGHGIASGLTVGCDVTVGGDVVD